MPAADATAVRDVALGYWAAYNAYDLEKTLSYLDEGYRASQEKTIRNEIGQIKNFGVKLGVSEKSAPVLTAPGPGRDVPHHEDAHRHAHDADEVHARRATSGRSPSRGGEVGPPGVRSLAGQGRGSRHRTDRIVTVEAGALVRRP